VTGRETPVSTDDDYYGGGDGCEETTGWAYVGRKCESVMRCATRKAAARESVHKNLSRIFFNKFK
jgi:hypothetical protein